MVTDTSNFKLPDGNTGQAVVGDDFATLLSRPSAATVAAFDPWTIPDPFAGVAARPRWVAWRYEPAGGKNPTKLPHSPPFGGPCSTFDTPQNWDTREGAEAARRRWGWSESESGLGLILGDRDGGAIVGVDLDSCIDPAGMLAPWAAEIIARFPTYGEISPSGTGIKLFCMAESWPVLRAAMEGKKKCLWKRKAKDGTKAPGFELLAEGYFTVTDQHFPGTPTEIATIPPAAFQWLISEAGPAFLAPAETEPASRPKDDSRSGEAWRLALKYGHENPKATREGMEAYLRANGDADVIAWCDEKGAGRELDRLWARAAEPRIGPLASQMFDGVYHPTAATDPPDDEMLPMAKTTGILSEGEVAESFAGRHRSRLRFDVNECRWYEWDSAIWRRDEKRRAYRFAHEEARNGAGAANATASKASFAGGVERLAQAHPALVITHAEWDTDPWLLGTPDGTVDLRTGELREARQSDRISKATAVGPAATADCPMWLKFLDEATAHDRELVKFLQRWFGYSLTGVTREEALLFIFGSGGNGKGVLMSTTANIMGDYSKTAAMDTFTMSRNEKHPTDMAMLAGARMVLTTEVEEGKEWAEAKLKSLTGGDKVSARFMGKDFFEFTPQFKLTISGNHQPRLRNVDKAFKRRFNLAPFVNAPKEEEEDKRLKEKLRAEWPAILRWMIDGCLEWQRDGLKRPEVIMKATATYFDEQDVVGRWMDARCVRVPGARMGVGAALADCKRWAEGNGDRWPTGSQLKAGLESRGIFRRTRNGSDAYGGLKFRHEVDAEKAEASQVEQSGGIGLE